MAGKKTFFASFLLWFAVCLMLPALSYAAPVLTVDALTGHANEISFNQSDADEPTQAVRVQFTVTGTDPNQSYTIIQEVAPLMHSGYKPLPSGMLEFSTPMDAPRDPSVNLLHAVHMPVVENQPVVLYDAPGADFTFYYDYYYRASGFADGSYAGRLMFRIISANAREPEPRFIDVFITVENGEAFTVTTSSQMDGVLELTSISEGLQPDSDYVEFAIDSAGEPFELHQQINGPIRNLMTGKTLLPEESGILFKAASAKGVAKSLDYSPLSMETSIYRNDKGYPDTLRVFYQIPPAVAASMDAGNYAFDLIYRLVYTDGRQLYRTLQVVYTIDPVFSVSVDSGLDGGLNYRDMTPGEGAVEKLIKVKISTNRHRPYKLIQSAAKLMTDPLGRTLPESSFRVRGIKTQDIGGMMEYERDTPISTGDMTLYTSDDDGTSEELQLVYTLEVPGGSPSGDYGAALNFTLVEK